MKLRLLIALTGGLLAVTSAQAVDLIFNEANSVGPRRWLDNPDEDSPPASCPAPECATGELCSQEADLYFGRALGNAGDWLELVVTGDHVDIRNWQLRWAETDNTAGNADGANGTNIWFGNGTIEQGIITFSNDPLWADLRQGTIITIIERSTAEGGLDTDTSFDPCAGDWWININSGDAQYLTCQTNIGTPTPGCGGDEPIGEFNVGNDNWQIRILNAALATVQGPIGEALGGTGWGGSGVNSRETIRHSANPSATPSIFDYEDSDKSSFGKANQWSDAAPGGECGRSQQFAALRSWLNCACATVVLNEYNAVGEDKWLDNPENPTGLCPEPTGPNGASCSTLSDSFFGRVLGNGGDWFELVVVGDHTDMRGWTLSWEEVDDNESGVITLSNNVAWSDLRTGTVITLARYNTANGGLDTNLSYNPAGGDRWINVHTGDAVMIASTTSTVGTHGFGDFHTSNDGWQLTIRNASNQIIGMTAGEGAAGYGGRSIGSNEVCSLQHEAADAQQGPTGTTRSWDNYNESRRSTFGAANRWTNCPPVANPPVQIQDLSVAEVGTSRCFRPTDINADGVVGIADLLNVIGGWGSCSVQLTCESDVNEDGSTGIADLLAVIGSWG